MTDEIAVEKEALETLEAFEFGKNPIEYLPIDIEGNVIPLAALYKGVDEGFVEIDLKQHVDKWRTAPERRKGTASALTLLSFNELVNRHKDDSSAVFADIISHEPKLTAVIDYHELDGVARFSQHRIVYKFPLSDEWKIWVGVDGKGLPQQAFAEFLEDRISDISLATDAEKAFYEGKLLVKFGTPSAINILSRGLTININSVVANAVTLQSGEGQIVFEEKHTDAKGKPLDIPGLFMIDVPLFFGGASIRVPVRLRYRKQGGMLMWSFALYNPKLFVKNALEGDLGVVREATGLPVFEGSPEV